MKFNKLLFIGLLSVLLIGFTSCGDDDDDMDQGSTIVDLAQNTPELSILVDALTKADLVTTLQTGDYTVFAPTNTAFSNFLSANNFASLDDVPDALLTNVLLNHVLQGETKSTSLSTLYTTSLATAQGNNVSMYINTDNGVRINGVSSVTTPDVDASNGVVHIVDAVIGIPTVVTFATADPTFATLVTALTRDDLDADYPAILSGDGPFTVFAPTNEAFGNLLDELMIGGLGDIDKATLTAVLESHVISGANARSTDIMTGDVITGLSGAELTVDFDGGTSLIDPRGREIPIVATDVQAGNGVIHAISEVILP